MDEIDDDFSDRFETPIRALSAGVALVEGWIEAEGDAPRAHRLAEARLALEGAMA